MHAPLHTVKLVGVYST